MIMLTEEQFKKLDEYRYDFQRNAQEQAINVYKELVRCEKELDRMKYNKAKNKK